MRNIRFIGAAATFAVGLFISSAQAQNIGVADATLEGQPLCQMTMDDVTAALGRPSGVNSPLPLFVGIIGPTVSYHSLGINFRFAPEADEPGAALASALTVHVARKWDEDNTEWFQVFSGDMDIGATGNWRIDQTLAELESYSPIHRTPDIQREEWIELGLLEPGEPYDFAHVVRLQAPDHQVNFIHEPITRFLEQFTILCNEGE